jgi:hypothetical protein
MEQRESEYIRQRESHPCMHLLLFFYLVPDYVVTDQRNLFNHSFKDLPPEPIYNVLMFQEMVYDKTDGFKKDISEVAEENRFWRE